MFFCGDTRIYRLVAHGFVPKSTMSDFILNLRCKVAEIGSQQFGHHGAVRNSNASDIMRIRNHFK